MNIKRSALLYTIAFCVMLLPVEALGGGVINLPKTGQTLCYNTSGAEITCTGTGQDGDIKAGAAWPSPRFTADGDCITDNLTGLMWPKNGDLPNGKKTWDDAIDYANSLNHCGYTDWRLPNVNELESLINAGEADISSWLNAQGFTGVHSDDKYWSSTSLASSPSSWAWYITMSYGDVAGDYKTSTYYVWPVRSGPLNIWKTGQTTSYRTGDDGDLKQGVSWPATRFIDNTNGEITDSLTGLIWTKDAHVPGPSACTPAATKTWQGALDYVKCLNTENYLGHSDWRLPNRKELRSLADYSQYYPALPSGHPFTNVNTSYNYWSSDTVVGDKVKVYVIDMIFEGILFNYKTDNQSVWPVRGPMFNLAVSKSGTGTGTVTSSPSGISCGTDCSENYAFGTSVTLTADADASSNFTTWSGACTGTGTCVVTVDASKNVTATFTLKTHAIIVQKKGAGTGSVSVSPGELTWDANIGTTKYDHGTTVTLTAEASANSTFTGWSGDCTGTDTCKVTVGASKDITATFAIKTYTFTPSIGDHGGVSPSVPTTVNYGTSQTFTITPDTGYHLSGLTDNETSVIGSVSGNTYTVTNVSANHTISATFAINTYTVTPSAGAGGNISPSMQQTVNYGSTTSFDISPNTGYHIADVSGCSGTLSGSTYTTGAITGACNVNAAFALNSYTLTVAKAGTGTGTVTSSPSGITCGDTCSSSYSYGASVTLTATADASSNFTSWSGDCSGNSTCTITMDTSKDVTAIFLDNSSLSNGLIAYYPFNGNADDESGKGKNGTVHGATLTADRFNQPNRAYSFDGVKNYIEIPHPGYLSKGTISGWVNFASVPTPIPQNGWMWFTISGQPIDHSWDGVDFGVHPGYSNNLVFGIYTSGWNWADSGVTPTASKWLHLVGTWGPDGIKIYINSTLKGTNPYTGGIPNDTYYTYIGANTWGGYVDAVIDDIRIYNRALSDAEVLMLYAGESQGKILTVTKSGTGSGTVTSSPSGINCGSTCSANYVSGTSVTLDASPASGSLFVDWSGDCSGNTDTTTVVMNANKTCDAEFTVLSGISLSAGWNFISLPEQPADPAIAHVLADISSNVRIVWGYDNQTKQWLKYTPVTLCPSPSALCSIEAGKGYWIYMDNPATLTFVGQSGSQTITLYEGWNLVGYNGTDNTGTQSSLSGLSDKWSIAWNWDKQAWKFIKNGTPISVPSIFTAAPLKTFKRGTAYWIKMNAATSWQQ